MADRDDEQELAYFIEDYPDWVFQHMPDATLPWEARRDPSSLPATGGHMWIGAPRAFELRALIDAGLTTEGRLATGPAANAYLEALRLRAIGAGWRAMLDWRVLHLTAPGAADDDPARTETVTCHNRLNDDDRFWFYDTKGLPIVEAENVVDAMVIIGGRLASPNG